MQLHPGNVPEALRCSGRFPQANKGNSLTYLSILCWGWVTMIPLKEKHNVQFPESKAHLLSLVFNKTKSDFKMLWENEPRLSSHFNNTDMTAWALKECQMCVKCQNTDLYECTITLCFCLQWKLGFSALLNHRLWHFSSQKCFYKSYIMQRWPCPIVSQTKMLLGNGAQICETFNVLKLWKFFHTLS